jgi:stearoyl-CoA desaturase (delta-9 desaturase)
MIETYGKGTPDDRIEKFYTKYNFLGILIMLWIDLQLFGAVGFIVWGIQMIWIPFWAAGVINGLGHFIGYKNEQTRDHSHNLVPWGIIVGGEELHNNHHVAPSSSKLSRRWFEVDIGWLYLRLFSLIGLAEIVR